MHGNGQDVRQYAGSALGGIAGASFGGTVLPQGNRLPLVAEQMQGLQNRTDALHGVISDIEGRLSSVLAQEPPTNEASAKAPQHGIGLVDGLVDVNARIDTALSRLGSLMRRVEL